MGSEHRTVPPMTTIVGSEVIVPTGSIRSEKRLLVTGEKSANDNTGVHITSANTTATNVFVFVILSSLNDACGGPDSLLSRFIAAIDNLTALILVYVSTLFALSRRKDGAAYVYRQMPPFALARLQAWNHLNPQHVAHASDH